MTYKIYKSSQDSCYHASRDQAKPDKLIPYINIYEFFKNVHIHKGQKQSLPPQMRGERFYYIIRIKKTTSQ